ncbi:MAG: ComF family protein [Gammaproteobacteria bacterium]
MSRGLPAWCTQHGHGMMARQRGVPRMVHAWLERVITSVYPAMCVLCSQPSHGSRELCHACARDLPWNRHACPRCALPMPEANHPRLCGRCLKAPPAWDSALSAFQYGWPLDQLLQRFKFHADLATGRLLGELLAEFMAATPGAKPELLIPVPLHGARLRERGFNQALELARPVSRRLRVPLNLSVCVRRKHTPAQSKLDARARRRNLRDAFETRASLAGARLAILDDVVTTGATTAALSMALRAAGAARITVWSLARAAHIV